MILPTNWSLLSLNEIAASGRGTFSNGPFGSDLVKADLTDAGLPVIYIRDIRDGYYDRVSTSCVTAKKAEQLSACWVEPGDVLIAKVGDPPGTAAVYPEDEPTGVVTQDVIRLRLNSEIADAQYVRNWLNSPLGKHAIKSITVEATRARFPLGEFKGLQIPLPQIAEQRRIAAILDRADAIRRKRQQAIVLTEELLRSAFLEMFGDPATNSKGWEIKSFQDVCERIFKGAFDLKASLYQLSGVPFIRISDIRDGTITLSSSVFIPEEAFSTYVSYSVIPGDLVFSKVGTIDRIGIVPRSIPKAVISQNNVGAKLKQEIIRPAFALAYLTTDYSLERIRATSKKAVQDKLVLSELRALSIPVPPLEYQDKFLKIQDNVGKIQQQICKASGHVDKLFNSLLQKAFRGEL